MRLTITGTKTEFAELFGGFTADARELIQLLINSKMIEKKEEIDNPKIYQVFEEVAWDTIYLMHLIVTNAGEQENDKGVYLTQEQLEELGMKERSASSRVGGTKRVCARLGLDDVLTIRKSKNTEEKRYYVAGDAITTLHQFLDLNIEEYRNFLDENDFSNPDEE